jgi:uncharacterized membrane protein
MITWKTIYICILILSVGIGIGKHGQKQKRYNAWTSFFALLINLFFLYKCGFFETE